MSNLFARPSCSQSRRVHRLQRALVLTMRVASARSVMDTLRKLGLGEEQISTSGYSVTPEMRYDGKQLQAPGYVARNSV